MRPFSATRQVGPRRAPVAASRWTTFVILGIVAAVVVAWTALLAWATVHFGHRLL